MINLRRFISKLKSFYNKISEINKDKKIIGIIIYKNNSKNKNKEIMDLNKSFNIFYEELTEEIDIEYYLKDILNEKYLNNFENKILKDDEGTYIGDKENNKKKGYGIKLYKQGEVFFIGNWKNDLLEGNEMFLSNEYIQIGEYKNEELISWETITIDVILSGIFEVKKGIIQEYFTFHNFLKYKVTFKDYEDSYGKLEIKNGNIYEGKFEKLCDYNKGEGTFFILMEKFIKENGKIIEKIEKESFIQVKEKYLNQNGKMIY